jgi:hypothetical protein
MLSGPKKIINIFFTYSTKKCFFFLYNHFWKKDNDEHFAYHVSDFNFQILAI